MEDKKEISKFEDPAVPEEEIFEMTPEEATAPGGGLMPKILNRKKLLIAICCSLALVVGGGLVYNVLNPQKKKPSARDDEFASSNSSKEFLSGLQNRALSRREQEAAQEPAPREAPEAEKKEPEPSLPQVSLGRPQETRVPAPAPQAASSPAPSSDPPQTPTHYKSPLVPPIQGSLFSQGPSQVPAAARTAADGPSAPQAARNSGGQSGQVSGYDAQNGQQNKQSFFDASSGGASGGRYVGANSVWTGTVIPGILETAINTDLPGNVLARVTQNIFDSQTGRSLLIPQGTLLLARYNSSISYAQKRVQIVWDSMIRPDGFQIDLEGANGVDRSGMSGQPAKFRENWFEYLKAAGIITLFSYANAKITETAAKYASEDKTTNLAASNADFVGRLGEQLASRAANIQPTLTVESGTPVNILLNKNLYLPPVEGYPASEKYSLE